MATCPQHLPETGADSQICGYTWYRLLPLSPAHLEAPVVTDRQLDECLTTAPVDPWVFKGMSFDFDTLIIV